MPSRKPKGKVAVTSPSPKDNRYGRKLVICDPVCVLPFGHAISALNHYRNYLADKFESVHCIVSARLPVDLEDTQGFERRFTHLYNQYIKVCPDNVSREDIETHPGYSSLYADPREEISTYDIEEVIKTNELSPEDIVFFPSADFYSIIGIINACRKISRPLRPRIMIRLIGVLEFTSPFYQNPQKELLGRLLFAASERMNLSISAETPDYADFLGENLGVYVSVTPYPETSPPTALPNNNTYRLFCAGSARLDKGFDQILSIFKQTRRFKTKRRIEVICQAMPSSNSEGWDQYTSQLYATPGVRLLPSSISTAEMLKFYLQSDAVLLPYAPDVYRWRGSAVLMEAACLGRPAIAYKGTAFSKQIDYYNLGVSCNNMDDIITNIVSFSNTPVHDMQKRVLQARGRFFADIDAAYEAWFGLQAAAKLQILAQEYAFNDHFGPENIEQVSLEIS